MKKLSKSFYCLALGAIFILNSNIIAYASNNAKLFSVQKQTDNKVDDYFDKDEQGMQERSGNSFVSRIMTNSKSTNRWSSLRNSYIYEQGGEIIVLDVDSDIKIDVYDKNTKKLKNSKTITFELPIFGGFYNGSNYNYIAFGQSNSEENNKKEVVRIVKYDKNFKKLNTLSINGEQCYTITPFAYGRLDMCENGDELTVHTSRERYTSEDGLNHQSQLTLTINTKDMKLKDNIENFKGIMLAIHLINE